MRSKLFVPGSRPDLFAKALDGAADALSFDLEDAVPDAGKDAARDRVAALLRTDAARASTKTIVIRVNGTDSAHFAADVAALAGARVDLVNLPKADRADQVRAAAAALAAAGCDARLLVTIESAGALLRAADIAAADPRVAGVQAGLNDLAASLGMSRDDPRQVHAALWTIRVAAGAAGCFAWDGAWPDLADEEGFHREATLARGLGYVGKSCIHPRQVPIANAVFADPGARVAAERLLAAAAGAAREGRGAFVWEGRMVDRPAIEAARALLAGTK